MEELARPFPAILGGASAEASLFLLPPPPPGLGEKKKLVVKNKNEIIAWDLAYDPCILSQLSPQEIRDRMYMTNEQLSQDRADAVKRWLQNKSPDNYPDRKSVV